MLPILLRVVVTVALALVLGVLLYLDDRVLDVAITGLAAGLLVIGAIGVLGIAAWMVRGAIRLVVDDPGKKPAGRTKLAALRPQTASGRPC
jgi:hypothetical protein